MEYVSPERLAAIRQDVSTPSSTAAGYCRELLAHLAALTSENRKWIDQANETANELAVFRLEHADCENAKHTIERLQTARTEDAAIWASDIAARDATIAALEGQHEQYRRDVHDTWRACLEAVGVDFSDLEIAQAECDCYGPKPSDTVRGKTNELRDKVAALEGQVAEQREANRRILSSGIAASGEINAQLAEQAAIDRNQELTTDLATTKANCSRLCEKLAERDEQLASAIAERAAP